MQPYFSEHGNRFLFKIGWNFKTRVWKASQVSFEHF